MMAACSSELGGGMGLGLSGGAIGAATGSDALSAASLRSASSVFGPIRIWPCMSSIPRSSSFSVSFALSRYAANSRSDDLPWRIMSTFDSRNCRNFATDIVWAEAARHTAKTIASKREAIHLHFRTRANTQIYARCVACHSLCASECRAGRHLELMESPSRRQRANDSPSYATPEGGIRAALPDEWRGVRRTQLQHQQIVERITAGVNHRRGQNRPSAPRENTVDDADGEVVGQPRKRVADAVAEANEAEKQGCN